jgi:hypothetical protein
VALPPALEPGFAPAVPWRLSRDPTLSVEAATLTALFGQYSQEEQAQRLYTRLEFDLYNSASNDWTPPVIDDVQTAATGASRLLEVDATDAQSVVRHNRGLHRRRGAMAEHGTDTRRRQ